MKSPILPVLLCALLTSAVCSTALADFEKGIAAYEANDLPVAYKEFRASAEEGHADSQFNVALMYEKGIGVAKDEKEAVAWYTKSAEQGNSAAQFNLGVLYETGQGVSVDRITAYMWYGRAALAGDRDAERRRDQLRLKLDSASITKGEKLISEWRPHPSDSIANEARTAGDAWKRREAKASE